MKNENERIDDLQCRGYKILQDPNGYCFTSDSVLLANLASVKHTDTVVDLCTGSGVIALLVAAKYEPKKVVGVELQPRLADMASRSVRMNRAENAVEIVNRPLQGVSKIIGSGFDVVTVNPPYEPCARKDDPTEEEICKTEQKVTCEEIVKESAALLRYGGLFYMINKTKRLTDVLFYMRTYGIEPKKLYFVQPKKGKDLDAFVVEGKRGGKPSFMKTPEPLLVYDEQGRYTEQVRSLYNQ